MIIIYGGIQPRGLVLSTHKFIIDTSKNQTVKNPTATTLRPTWPPTPPPIRGTVPPLNKWGIYDHTQKPPETNTADLETIDQIVQQWAKDAFQFEVEEFTTENAPTHYVSTQEKDELENLLLNTLDQLVAQYANSSETLI